MRQAGKKSTKGLFIGVAAIAIAGAGAFLVLQKNHSGGTDISGISSKETGAVVAEVNGKPLYSEEANEQLVKMTKGANKSPFEGLDGKEKYIVVRELAAQKLILEEAMKKGFDKDDRVKDRVDEYKKDVMKEEFLTAMAKDAITEERLKGEYDRIVKELEGKTQYKTRHILVKSEAEANDLVSKLANNESFDQLAKKKSLDTKTSLSGGDLGYLVQGNMIPEFDKLLPSLADGQVSAPVHTKFGWHVVKVESRRPAQAIPYDQVKESLARELYKGTIQDYVQGVITNAKIEVVGAQASDAAAAPAAVEVPAAVPGGVSADVAPAAAPEEASPVEAAPAAEPAAPAAGEDNAG